MGRTRERIDSGHFPHTLGVLIQENVSNLLIDNVRINIQEYTWVSGLTTRLTFASRKGGSVQMSVDGREYSLEMASEDIYGGKKRVYKVSGPDEQVLQFLIFATRRITGRGEKPGTEVSGTVVFEGDDPLLKNLASALVLPDEGA